MTTPLKYDATSGVVARAWLRTVLPAAVGVDRALPSDITTNMRTSGFVVARTIGGGPDTDVALREPVIGVECWFPPTSDIGQQQWNAAEALANDVIKAAYAWPMATSARPVPFDTRLNISALGMGAYRPARVHSVVPVSEPRESPEDPGNFARFDIDVLIYWTEN